MRPAQSTLINAWIWNFCWTARNGMKLSDACFPVSLSELASNTHRFLGHRTQSELAKLAAAYLFDRASMHMDAVGMYHRFWQLCPCLTQDDWDYALGIFRRYYV